MTTKPQPVDLTRTDLDDLVVDLDATKSEHVDPPVEFRTGAAGTGKTFSVRAEIEKDPKRALLCATTGIAAVNLGTVTLHSTLGLHPDSIEDQFTSGYMRQRMHNVARQYRSLGIDEMSMLRHDLLDMLYTTAEQVNDYADVKEPFGLTLIGDLCQLPPIAEKHEHDVPWVMNAQCWPRFEAATTTLTKNWRQGDGLFLDALNHLRAGNGRSGAECMRSASVHFERSLNPTFDGTVILGRNLEVDNYNLSRYWKLKGHEFTFPSKRWGKESGGWRTIPEVLKLKVGAYVMVLANDTERDELTGEPLFRWVNGDCGYVVDVEYKPAPEDDEGHVDEDAIMAPSFAVRLVRTGQVVDIDYIERRTQSKSAPDEFTDEEVDAAKNNAGAGAKLPDGTFYDPKKGFWVRGSITYMPLRLAYATTVHKCVAGDTRVPISGRGLAPISTVQVGDHTPYGRIKGVAASEQMAWKITTEAGYEVVCSEDHKWLTSIGMVPTGGLCEGDKIEVTPAVYVAGCAPKDATDPILDADFFWFLGLLVGDGCYTDRKEGQLHLAQITKSVGDDYIRFLNRMNVHAAWRKDKRGVHSTSKPFRNYLHSIGLEYVKAPSKRIPSCVWNGGTEAWGPFLRGLFDADGHVGRSFIVLTTASENLGKDVQQLLLFMGIPSKRRVFKGKRDPYWQVFISAIGLERFTRSIGFSHPDKSAKLRSLQPNRWIVRWNGFDKIKSVVPLNIVVPMWDVEVDDPHVFCFGGIMGSNSQGLTLDRIMVDLRHAFLGEPAMVYVAMSRCRTAEGLHVVGDARLIERRCKIDEKVRRWL